MTAQVPDTLTLDGAEFLLHTEPLESFFGEDNPKPDFRAWGLATCCWRGYVGAWEIRDRRLYLLALTPFNQPEVDLLKVVFPSLTAPIPALWFTGELVLESGELLEYVHGGYASKYEKETVLVMRGGFLESDA